MDMLKKKKRALKGIPVRIHNPYLIWMKDFSFDQHLGRGIPLMSGMYTWLFPWKFSHIYSSYEPQKVQLHTKTLEMHVLWRISACFQTRDDNNLLSHRSSGMCGVAVLSQGTGDEQCCCFCCGFGVCLSAWERRRNLSDKTAEGRELGPKYWEWRRHWDKELLGSVSWCSVEGWRACR